MSETEYTTVPALTINFASPEATQDSIGAVSDALTANLKKAANAAFEAESAYRTVRANAELAIRNSGIKVTEGYVSTAIDADKSVEDARRISEKAQLTVAGIRADMANLESKVSLFKEWMRSQRPVGV